MIDAGGDPAILSANMGALGIDPKSIDALVITHRHLDHTGGAQVIARPGLRLFAPPNAEIFENSMRELGCLVSSAEGPSELLPGVWSTGPMTGFKADEQSVVIGRPGGPIVITGCAHPGIVNVAAKARTIVDGDPQLLLGGFHLKEDDDEAVEKVGQTLQKMGVKRIAPCHCSGDGTLSIFARLFGADFISVGVGSVVRIGDDDV